LSDPVDRGSILIQNGLIVCRRSEIGVIENIENFGTELDVESFRNFLDGIVFEE
jgi:hypothetical protein